MTGRYIMSQDGYDKLVAQIADWKENQRPKVLERLQKARAMGDLKENSEYSASREDLNLLDSQIAEAEERLANAEITATPQNSDIVEVGNTVEVESDGTKLTYMIVGEVEADMLQNKISNTSPIGMAFLGKKKGETVVVEIPAGKKEYKILDIK